MKIKSAGANIDPKLAELQWQHMLPYYTDDIVISKEALAGAREFFRLPAEVTDEMMIEAGIASKK